MTKPEFAEIIKESFPLLAQYTPVLARVHGENHPELAKVRDIFARINDLVQEAGAEQADLTAEFKELREITDNYAVPADGCETYFAAYGMLEKADKVYNS